jgi:hypothetical protein
LLLGYFGQAYQALALGSNVYCRQKLHTIGQHYQQGCHVVGGQHSPYHGLMPYGTYLQPYFFGRHRYAEVPGSIGAGKGRAFFANNGSCSNAFARTGNHPAQNGAAVLCPNGTGQQTSNRQQNPYPTQTSGHGKQ